MSQCEEIRKAHLESGKVFATGFVLRYADFYKKIKELLDSGDFGKVVSIEANELLSPDHGGYIMRYKESCCMNSNQTC
jgi:predicted dehydrogenase